MCKTAVNWVTKTISRMTRRKALKLRETKISNCEVIPQAIWPIAKFLMNRDGPKKHHPLSTDFPVSDLFLWRKPTQLLSVWKMCSHHMNCVTNVMKSRWRFVSQL